MSNCCPECFGDRGLSNEIFPSISQSRGRCDFCNSENVLLIEPGALLDWFELLISIYEPNPEGKFLVELLREDWLLFTHPNMDNAHSKELLSEILNDGEIVRQRFSPSQSFISEGLIKWETLRDEILYKNRYFLQEKLDTDRLKELLDHLQAQNLPEIWYRSRIQNSDVPFTIEEMGAPPNRLTTNGRANPIGIPYLYLGSLPESAIAEVRPHTGETICVADFRIAPPLSAVDLRNPRKLVSPFLLEDANSIGQLRADIPFLERLGDELTRPVLPQSAGIDYIPSQYLCEFIKNSGYDGVIYRSSVSDGINLALFIPQKAQAGSVKQYKISKVDVQITELN